jgi:CxxC motif-containing protein
MKRMVCVLCALVCALVLAVSAAAQSTNVTGDWDVTINSPQGARVGKLSLKQEGEKLTGMIKSQRGEIPLEGEVKGKEIKFKYTVKFQDQDLTIALTGNVDADAMKGDADFGGFAQGDWNAKRASAAASSGAPAAPAQSGEKGGEKGGEKIDVTGVWSVTVETEAGSGNPSFTFKQEGEKLTGKYKGLLGEADLTGTVKGDKIEFSFKVSGQVEGVVTYAGTTDGKTMKGKVNLAGVGEGTFSGKKQ